MSAPAAVYHPRNPQSSDYYRCVEDHFETLIQVYEERFERLYGFFRSYVQKVIYRYLDCGDLHNGFARVKCKDCGHEYLLAFSCKRRHFCPSCHQKRVVEFGEWLCSEVLKNVPHWHFTFSIPKILRRYFLYDRSLLSDLSRCAWESLKVFLQEVVPEKTPVPGAIIAIQTFGDFLGFNPHCHILVTDGCFYGTKDMFRVAPPLDLKKLETIFQHRIFKMLLAKGKVNREMIAMLSNWRHSGFNVFCGRSPDTVTAYNFNLSFAEIGWTALGLVDINDDGTLNVWIKRVAGDFYLDCSTLTTWGNDGTCGSRTRHHATSRCWPDRVLAGFGRKRFSTKA